MKIDVDKIENDDLKKLKTIKTTRAILKECDGDDNDKIIKDLIENLIFYIKVNDIKLETVLIEKYYPFEIQYFC